VLRLCNPCVDATAFGSAWSCSPAHRRARKNSSDTMKTMKQFLLSLLCLFALGAHGANPTSLKLIQTIPLPDVKGRIDHLEIDTKGRRLFVAALGNNTVEVLDLNAGTGLRSVAGCSKPQGLLYLPRPNLLFVAKGGDGRVRIYDCSSFRPIVTVGAVEDAEHLRYDAKLDRVYVG